MNSEFLIPIAFFAMIYGIVYLVIRKKERMTLITKGADASIFESKKNEPASLKWGLLLIGIGIGILMGKVLAVYSCLDEEPAFFSMICLFGGIGLVLFHLIARKFPEPPKSKE